MQDDLKKITLNDTHEQLNGKMVPFAGYLMPVRYSSGMEEHRAVRENVGVFDVSHMGEFILKGPQALPLIQKITTNDASKLKIGQAQYSCFPNEFGGIVDDLLVYRIAEDEFMLVVNASNIEKDWNWINQHNAHGAQLFNLSNEISLLAVQGPNATKALQLLTPVELGEITFYHFEIGPFAGVEEVIISATGYTGAGGFELYVKNRDVQKVWNAIFENGKQFDIKPIGLGARDTLRLEMGYCLYGNDINDHTSPLEAGLGWITKFNKDFINKESLERQKKEGIRKKLVGFVFQEKGIPRAHYSILNEEGNTIGEVTSGSLSPSMGVGIGLGYVQIAYAKPGTKIFISVRNKNIEATIEKLPLLKK